MKLVWFVLPAWPSPLYIGRSNHDKAKCDSKVWGPCFLLLGAHVRSCAISMPPCGDFTLMGGSKEYVHLSHWGGQQKLGLLSKAKQERRRHTQRPNRLWHHTLQFPARRSCSTILHLSCHHSQRQTMGTSPAHKQERRGRHRALWPLHLGLGASLRVRWDYLGIKKGREMLHSQGPQKGLQTEKLQCLIYESLQIPRAKFTFCLRVLERERIRGRWLFFSSFEDLDSICRSRECVMHNCHRVPPACTQSAFRFLGWRN